MSQKEAETREDASEHWQAVKSSWSDHVQHLHDKASDKKAQVDLRLAQRDADGAEDSRQPRCSSRWLRPTKPSTPRSAQCWHAPTPTIWEAAAESAR